MKYWSLSFPSVGNDLVLTKPRSMRVEDSSRDVKRIYEEFRDYPAELVRSCAVDDFLGTVERQAHEGHAER